jgi:hypothetical protein
MSDDIQEIAVKRRERPRCPRCQEEMVPIRLSRGTYAHPCGHCLRITPPRPHEKRKTWKRNYAAMGMWQCDE